MMRSRVSTDRVRVWPWRAFLGVLAAAVLALSACATPAATNQAADLTPEEQDLYQAAIDEGGQLAIYTGWLNAESTTEAFMERYPEIEVELVRAASGITAARFASEYRAGVHAADILELGDTFTQEAHPEWFQPVDVESVPNVADWPDKAVHLDGLVIDTAYNSISFIAYNTELVQEDQVPDSWEGLLDPQWRGKLTWVHPGAGPTYMGFARYAHEAFGEEYIDGLVAQQPRFVDSSIPGAQQVAAGAASLGFPYSYQAIAGLKEDGAPIEAKLISQPFGIQATMSASIPAKAPHPAAARLFMNWLMSTEGQAVHCAGGATGIIDVDDPSCLKLPEGFKSVSVDTPDPVEQSITTLVGELS